jgi:hypothetical protein
MPEIELLSVVALLQDLPEKGLRRGQVGTIVESLARECTKSSLATTVAERMQCLPSERIN